MTVRIRLTPLCHLFADRRSAGAVFTSGSNCSDETAARHCGRQAGLGAIPAVLLTDARLRGPDFVWIPRYATPVHTRCSCTPDGSICSATCCSCGSSATTSSTRWGTSGISPSSSPAGSRRCSRRHSPTRIPPIRSSGRAAPFPGVLGAYLVLFPRAKVLTLGAVAVLSSTTLRVPAMALLLVWFAAQLLSAAAVAGGNAGVAFRAHIGGFVAGVLLVTLLKRREVRLLAR